MSTTELEKLTLASEAIRAYFTLQCCWLNDEEIYLEKGCQNCGAAATYLIYFTDSRIQKLLLNFIRQYNCIYTNRTDLLDLPEFEKKYNLLLQNLELEVNRYACENQNVLRKIAFEDIYSIFDRITVVA